MHYPLPQLGRIGSGKLIGYIIPGRLQERPFRGVGGKEFLYLFQRLGQQDLRGINYLVQRQVTGYQMNRSQEGPDPVMYFRRITVQFFPLGIGEQNAGAIPLRGIQHLDIVACLICDWIGYGDILLLQQGKQPYFFRNFFFRSPVQAIHPEYKFIGSVLC